MNQTMKILRRIKLVGWHFFENETIHFSSSNLLSGENGSGKSTILDAIQLVLTSDTKHFNNAANDNSKRDVRSYVRGKTGEEGATAYKRKGSVISYIALEFYEESRDRFFVIGVKIDSIDEESEPKKKWFCEEGTLDDLSFIVENKPARDDQFKNKGKKISFINQSKAARERFGHRLGNLQETFRELVIKSIAFKPMKDVRSFVSQFILPEKAIDVETLRDNINALKSMQDTLAEVKRQVAALDDIIAKASDIDQTHRRIMIIDILLKIAELKNIQQNIRQINNTIEKLEQEKLTLQDNESMITAELSSRRKEHTEILVAINSNECARLISEYKSRLERLAIQLDRAKTDADSFHTQIERIKKALKTVPEIKADLTDEMICLLGSDDITDEQKNEAVISVCRIISERIVSLSDQRAEQRAGSKVLEDRLKELSKRIDDLKRNNRLTYDANTTALKNAVIAEFRKRGIDSEVRVFANLLEIKDTSWQNAVEGYLNTQRFHIIVEPQYYHIAAEVYDKNKSRIHTAALVNTAALDLNKEIPENSLANMAESKNRYARAYANYLLGRVTVCESTDQLFQYPCAITKACMLYQGKTLRKINPDIYRVPFIGKYALKVQLEMFEKEYKEKSEKQKQIKDDIHTLSRYIELLSQINPDTLKSCLFAPARYKEFLETITETRLKLREAEKDPTILELQYQAEELHEKIEKLEARQKEINTDIARCIMNTEQKTRVLSELEDSEKTAAGLLEQLGESNPSEYREADEKYQQNERSKTADTIFSNYQPRKQALNNRYTEFIVHLRSLQQNYKYGELGIGREYMKDYLSEYDRLTRGNLLEYEEKLREIQKNCETEFRETFLSKMRENINNAHDLFRSLNKTLKPISYGGDRYQFRNIPSVSKQKLYEMIMSKFNIEGFNLFSQQFDEEYHDEMEELFAKLTVSDAQGDEVLREYTDYRNYMDYDIEIISQNDKTQKFSNIYREKSGGETQTPYYVAIAASFSQLYQYGETIRLIILDEAFDKMDEERISGMMQFFKELNFQMILAAPSSRLEIIGENTDRILMVYKDSDHYSSMVEEFSL